jgi:hypothetical protein
MHVMDYYDSLEQEYDEGYIKFAVDILKNEHDLAIFSYTVNFIQRYYLDNEYISDEEISNMRTLVGTEIKYIDIGMHYAKKEKLFDLSIAYEIYNAMAACSGLIMTKDKFKLRFLEYMASFIQGMIAYKEKKYPDYPYHICEILKNYVKK